MNQSRPTKATAGAPAASGEPAGANPQPATTAPPTDVAAPGAHGLLVVLVPLMLVLFIATLDQTIVATAIPGIGRALQGAGPGTAGARGRSSG